MVFIRPNLISFTPSSNSTDGITYLGTEVNWFVILILAKKVLRWLKMLSVIFVYWHSCVSLSWKPERNCTNIWNDYSYLFSKPYALISQLPSFPSVQHTRLLVMKGKENHFWGQCLHRTQIRQTRMSHSGTNTWQYWWWNCSSQENDLTPATPCHKYTYNPAFFSKTRFMFTLKEKVLDTFNCHELFFIKGEKNWWNY